MASIPAVLPSADLRSALGQRGGDGSSRCYQCATCSSVCELAPAEAPFPRRQMLWAQWGLVDRLVADPGVWLCHQCNDCSARCPREAHPGDVMAAVRGAVIERLATPRWLGRMVGNARTTWPLLIGIPIVFWIVLLGLTTGLAVPHVNPALTPADGLFHYEEFVPHPHIYAVYLLISAWVVAAAWVSGRRFWKLLGAGAARPGSFLANLVPTLVDISTPRRFSPCTDA